MYVFVTDKFDSLSDIDTSDEVTISFVQAAMAAYLKDVENNTRDMTAQKIIKEKLNRIEIKEVSTLQTTLLNLMLNFRFYTEENNIRCKVLRVAQRWNYIFLRYFKTTKPNNLSYIFFYFNVSVYYYISIHIFLFYINVTFLFFIYFMYIYITLYVCDAMCVYF